MGVVWSSALWDLRTDPAIDDATFDRVVDKDSIEGYIRKYWQLVTVQRNANGVIEDLNDISSIDKVA